MKDRKSIPNKELIDFIREVRAFIAALNRGATADQLKKIKDSLRVRRSQKVLRAHVFARNKKVES